MQGLFFIRIRKEFYMRALTMSGYAAPKGITNVEELKRLQKTIGVAPDGIWGAASQKAYDSYLKRFSEPLTSQYQVGGYSAPGIVRNRSDVKVMQEVLGNVAVDGIWGPETDAAYRQRLALDNAPQGGSANAASRLVSALADTRPVLDNSIPVPVKALSGGLSGQSVNRPIPRTVLPTFNRPAASAASRPMVQTGSLKQNISDIPHVVDSAYANITEYSVAYPQAQDNVLGNTTSMPTQASSSGDKPKVHAGSQQGGEYQPFKQFTSLDDIVVYASNYLNYTTAWANREACCNLYSVVMDGKKHYFTGNIFTGEYENVIEPYTTDALWEYENVFMQGLNNLKFVTYEGLMHTHPFNNFSEGFSGAPGDATVALLSGNIFLTTPKGNIYNLARPDDMLLEILSGAMGLIGSALTNQQVDPAAVNSYLDAWNTLFDWSANPPTIPYKNGLHSIDTTGISQFGNGPARNLPKVITQIIQRYIEREIGPLGFNLYEEAQKLGSELGGLFQQYSPKFYEELQPSDNFLDMLPYLNLYP